MRPKVVVEYGANVSRVPADLLGGRLCARDVLLVHDLWRPTMSVANPQRPRPLLCESQGAVEALCHWGCMELDRGGALVTQPGDEADHHLPSEARSAEVWV